MKNLKILFKLFLSLFLAFLVSQILVTKVTFRENPILRPSFQQTVHNLPTKIVDQIRTIASFPKRFFTQSQNPPPWIEPVIKPTIVSFKPPVYYPPTPALSPSKGPKPTAIPDYTPTPTSPSSNPTITRFPPSPSPTPLIPPITPTLTPQLPSSLKSSLLFLINQERQKNNISLLSFHNALNTASQTHSDDMHQNNYFSHIGKDGSTPADRAQKAGYPSSAVGENIAAGTSNPSQVFSMWIQSTGHRQNMLNPAWKSAGIGLSGNIWVLMLGAK